MTRGVGHDSAASWTFATCLACRQQALVDPAGGLHCPTCTARADELARLLASVARVPIYRSLRSALLGTSTLFGLRPA